MREVRRFACTQCGACCNRSPEVELSEAAALADIFVFRLMFRLFTLPRLFDASSPGSSTLFYEKKRLLAAHSAHQFSRKLQRGSRRVEVVHYVMISALTLDTGQGSCAALVAGRCGIHDRRPLGCRAVPFHYSRPESLAVSDFDAFVSTPGYRCDTSERAAPFVDDGRIVEPETLRTRADALALAARDRPWKEAIVRRMKLGGAGLPTLQDVEANAQFAAMTTSMRIGWQIAADAGLISTEACRAAIEQQRAIIERELARGEGSTSDRDTLREMRAEYRD